LTFNLHEHHKPLSLIKAGFRPGRRGPFVSAKGPKTMFAPSWPCGSPARFANSGGCATRCAQTVLAENPGVGCTARPCWKAYKIFEDFSGFPWGLFSTMGLFRKVFKTGNGRKKKE